MTPAEFLNRILPAYRAQQGPIQGFEYIDGFIRRNRAGMERMLVPLVALLNARASGRASAPPLSPVVDDGPVEAWTVKRRTDANLAAMDLLAGALAHARDGRLGPRDHRLLTLAERRTLLGYSGWGYHRSLGWVRWADGWLSRTLSGRPKREVVVKAIREMKRERRSDWHLAPSLGGHFGVPDETIVEWLRHYDICPGATTRSMASQCVIEDVESMPVSMLEAERSRRFHGQA